MEITPLNLASYMEIGHYNDLFDNAIPPELRAPMLAGKLQEQLDKHKATIVQKDGLLKIVQAEDNELSLMINGQEATVRQIADIAMNIAHQPEGTRQATTQTDNRPDALKKAMRQSFADFGMEERPSTIKPLSQSDRYLQPFKKALQKSIADQEKNFKQ
jgi:hypothetical protein